MVFRFFKIYQVNFLLAYVIENKPSNPVYEKQRREREVGQALKVDWREGGGSCCAAVTSGEWSVTGGGKRKPET